jgi:glyoxylase-like metal-dependent hydrolase (beta-lactamase superfamily II)
MKIGKLDEGPYYCNTYILEDEEGSALVIDPGDNRGRKGGIGRIDAFLMRHSLTLKAVLLTHGHSDHIEGLLTLREKAPVYMGEGDFRCLTSPKYNNGGLTIDGIEPLPAVEGEPIAFGDTSIEVIETPFHTMGSVCYYVKKFRALFSGDTLFRLSVGRTDLPGGDERLMGDSLSKLRRLPPNTRVYPGHGPATDIGTELAYNPYFRR